MVTAAEKNLLLDVFDFSCNLCCKLVRLIIFCIRGIQQLLMQWKTKCNQWNFVKLQNIELYKTHK